jgi:hypothetical protein
MSAIRIMFGAAAAIVALSFIAQGSTGAAQPEKAQAKSAAKVRTLEPGQAFDWNADEFDAPVRLRAADMEIVVAPVRDPNGLVGPRVTVSAPGREPSVLEGDRAGLTFPSRISVGRWDKTGALFVLLESYTGGAHCCTHVQAAVPKPGGFEVADLDAYDGERLARLPEDLDGDGAVDFLVTDDAFLYAFSSYAGSFPPPKVLHIVEGKAVDVSSRAGFRPLFAQAMEKARPRCEKGEPGYCAGYAAAAARAGRFAEAWPQILRFTMGKAGPGDLPTGCRVDPKDGECPVAETIRYASYEEALKAFLARHGYIES